MKKYALEIIVFIAGAVVMVLEIAGTRLLAPYFGTSLPVWTAIISTVLASLSFGYWYGGKLADKGATYERLAFLLAFSGALVGATLFLQSFILASISDLRFSLIWEAVIAVIVLLAPAAILLGVVSPYAVKLRMDSLATSGATVGRLSALSATGSILGTFLAGVVLLRVFGSLSLLCALAVVLLLLPLLIHRQLRFVLGVLALSGVIIAGRATMTPSVVADVDTAYNRIWVIDRGRERILSVGGVSESAMYLDKKDELVFPYTKFYRLSHHFMPGARRALMLGGAGYSYPRDFLRNFPNATIDVVEIDPGMTEVARDYFGLMDDKRMRIVHEDGRVFLNESTDTYDIFFGDAFGSFYSIPYQLTTQEAVERIHGLLAENGVAIVNLIGTLEGDTGKFIRAEYWTYRKFFPHVYLFPVSSSDARRVQNIMLVAVKGESDPALTNVDAELGGYLTSRWKGEVARDVPILTDDFAPVDQYIASLLRR